MMNDIANTAIAIVGVGAILPQAPTAPAFWQNIKDKRYCITEVPPERWSIADYYDPDPAAPDKTYSKIGGWVRGFQFDWKKYRVPPKVAAAMDEGQQWAVTIAAEALADYGYPDRPLDTDRCGVIMGTAMGGELHYITHLRVSFPEYAHLLEQTTEFQQLPAAVRNDMLAHWRERVSQNFPEISEDSMPGELANIVSGRVANVLNLRGPSFVTDAACASALAAINASVELLSQGHCDAVLTGGVDRNMGVSSFIKFCKIGALSATGSRPFGDGADGFVMGEGSAAFLLKRLADAERDGDKIYAVIRGVGGSSDGKGKGITAPNPIGQVLATRRAWENAGLDPATATMVEAHGTSTKVGDVVEVESLAEVFGQAPRQSIAIGSAKSNIGHLKAGAGAAGMLKAVMAVHDKLLPPTLHAEKPNPNIDFERTPFFVNHELREWPAPANAPRRAGVSAYGFGGTNFHVVLEEHVPGMLKTNGRRAFAGVQRGDAGGRSPRPDVLAKPPLRGILALGAETPVGLKDRLDETFRRLQEGLEPPLAAPDPADLSAPERLVIDFGDHDELLERVQKARKAMGFDNPAAWKALAAQGIFRGSGKAPGKIAFLFPGQGSQYANMGRELAAREPVVKRIFADADRVMTPILGRPLTDSIFVDASDPAAMKQAEFSLMQTAITQPAVLTMDTAVYELLAEYGIHPDMVMGHSLGEYGALIAAGVMHFADALEASAARGREMTAINNLSDNGWMAAVLGPLDTILATLKEVDGYVIPANINSYNQVVIGGASKAVEQAIDLFNQRGMQAMRIPVSHAFHTSIVAGASKPLRKVLDKLEIREPQLPLVANVTGDVYPTTVEGIKDILEQQVAATVQWVKGLETLYAQGCRVFVEVGPKKALKGFVDDVLGNKPDVISLFTNHPKFGELPTFNQALCGLYAAGYGATAPALATGTGNGVAATQPAPQVYITAAAVPAAPPAPIPFVSRPVEVAPMTHPSPVYPPAPIDAGQLAQAIQMALNNVQTAARSSQPYDRNDAPLGSVVISGTGLGLPGAEKPLMDADNALRILRGEQFIDLIPERFRHRIQDKRITRVVKAENGGGSFQVITDPDEVIKLAGRPGVFDLEAEYGVPAKLIEALDTTTQMALAAGLDALREAGIPLVQTFKPTTTGKFLPDRWLLPVAMRDETGVIFASAFPGGDRFAEELTNFYTWQNRLEQIAMLEDLRRYASDAAVLQEIQRRIANLREQTEREPYFFDRRFLFRILAMGHSQFAEYIGARGPNTHVNAACASTAQAVAIAEDWIRSGRCRRVIVIGADNVTGDHLLEWVGAGFLATGAAATDNRVDMAALPFDKRRHGTILGMGACALVVESEDALRERGMRGIVELLSSETSNSAYHGTRLDVDHISQVMENLVAAAERRFGLNRYAVAPQMVFMSHETFTPARGGSASAEVIALRKTFGEAANDIVVANTKGFTGHPMGVGVEDVIAIKALEYGIVPPVPNFKEVDPDLGVLNLSRGGRYPVQYALHLAAGFGSQIALTLTRRIPGGLDRIDNKPRYARWLADISGNDSAETEVAKRVLRVKSNGAPGRTPVASAWQYGLGPNLRAAAPGDGVAPSFAAAYRPAPMAEVAALLGQKTDVQERKTEGAPAPLPQPAPLAPSVPVAAAAPVVLSVPVQATPPASPTPVVSAPALPPAVPQSPAPVTETLPAKAVDPVVDQVLALVAAKTGYPQDMLDLDLDLEADLGIDTVKQAETFAAIREAFAIPLQEGISLRDYPTLASVIGFVRTMRPDLPEVGEPRTEVREQKSGVSAAPAAVAAQPQTSVPQPDGADPIVSQVLALVAAKTGYPEDMLEVDLDLEADLGIDTVKQAETFAAIRETFGIPVQEGLSLRDYPTLGSVISFVRTMRPDLGAAKPETPTPAPAAVAAPPPATAPQPDGADPVVSQVLALVAAKTGYPEDMLELDLDLEADLGIDTVKQAETFAAVRETFAIPVQEELSLRDYPTLGSVIGFVRTMRPDLAEVGEQKAEIRGQKAEVGLAPAPLTKSHAPTTIGSLEDADKMPRRVPVPVLRPAIELCQPTGVTLDAGSRVVVMMDRGGIGKSLVSRLEKLGVSTLTVEPGVATADLDAQIKAWLGEGAIQGVYWLAALDVEPDLEDMTLGEWRELNRQRVKNLYTTLRALYESVRGPGRFLVSATRLGGLHGYGPEGASAPLGGAVTGFSKAYNVEQGMKPEGQGLLVKAVDFELGRKTAEPADQLIAETLYDPGAVEVGYQNGLRFAISLAEKPASDGNPGMILGPDTVFVVTGAAGGITSAIVTDLAVASRGVFYLLDLVPCPARDDDKVRLFRSDKEALKLMLIEEARRTGEKPTPKQIDQQIIAIERSEAALRAVETAEAAGASVHYVALDLRDGDAVSRVVEAIRARYGRIDVLLHAGGLLIDRTLPNKEPNQFDLVFDVKADGFFSLLKAAQGMPIGATVCFSSVAGRFGNNGQSDYASANDLLCKISSSMRRWRPDTRGIAIDWTAWGQIGMASRGSVPQIMEALGVDMLAPEAGVPTIRRELTYGATRGEIVVAGRLGAWMQEHDPAGGLDQTKAAAALTARSPRLPMIGEIKAAKLYGGIEVETALDPRIQPFLFDHMPDADTPWLPGVMATEALAEVASLLAPGYRVAAVESEEMMGAFKFFRMEPRTLYLNATITPAANGDLLARTTLRSLTKPAKEGLPVQVKEHFTATVRLQAGPIAGPAIPFQPPVDLPITAGMVYKRFFHGPAYQVIERALVTGNRAIGLFPAQLPPDTAPAVGEETLRHRSGHASPLLVAPRLIELCFQLAALWHQESHGAMAFPLGFSSVTAYRQPAEASGRLYGVVSTADEGESFDCQVLDETGNLFVELKGYRTVARPA